MPSQLFTPMLTKTEAYIGKVQIFISTRLWPAFGRQSLVGSSGGNTSHGYTSHASPRACGARLGQFVQELMEI